MENEFENEGMVFESRTHWYNAQKKFLKKREFWRAVIYALTRPDEYKDVLLKKSEQITPEAMRILRWYWAKVPAND